MVARAIENAERELTELHREEWADFGLAVAAFAVALAVGGALRAAFLLGALFALGLGVRAAWRRWELIDRLVLDRDAHAIRAVRTCAARSATMSRRCSYAAAIRSHLEDPEPLIAPRIERARQELAGLADDLEDERLALDPAAAVACDRLVTDGLESPLLNSQLPSEELLAKVLRLRDAFRGA